MRKSTRSKGKQKYCARNAQTYPRDSIHGIGPVGSEIIDRSWSHGCCDQAFNELLILLALLRRFEAT